VRQAKLCFGANLCYANQICLLQISFCTVVIVIDAYVCTVVLDFYRVGVTDFRTVVTC
jgi:hypothetical protein